MGVTVTSKKPIKKEVKQAIGTTTTQHKDGTVVEKEEVVKEKVFDGPVANVGVSIGLTRNLGNYESVKMTVSLFMPCVPEEEEINSTYEEVKGWVDTRIEQISQEVSDQLGK